MTMNSPRRCETCFWWAEFHERRGLGICQWQPEIGPDAFVDVLNEIMPGHQGVDCAVWTEPMHLLEEEEVA